MASTARLDELKKKFDENPRRYFAPLANEHRKSGDLEQAISLCRAHLPQQPAHISGHIVLAQALFEAGQLDESRTVFQTALELDPENLIALRSLGDIARDSGDIASARSWYGRVLEVDPRNDEIVQLVRDLDAPPSHPEPTPAVEDTSAAPAAAADLEPAEVPVPAEWDEPAESAAQPPAADDRFAPLAIDEIDIAGDVLGDTEQEAFDAPPAPATAAPEAIDLHADWSTEAPTVELPALDAGELDPFDMPSSASAESLFDPSQHAGDDDALFRDLSGADPTLDVGSPEAAPGLDEVWAPEPESSDAPAPSPRSSGGELFEEGSFYLENADIAASSPMPASYAAPRVDDGAPTTDMAESEDAESAPSPVNELPADADWAPAESEVAAGLDVEMDGWSADAPGSAHVDEPDTAEPEYAARPFAAGEPEAAPVVDESDPAAAVSAADDSLGLEVMEFVPPARDDEAAPAGASKAEADPLLGHMPEMTPADEPPPAAFVTETMAELYLQQGFRTEALAVYRELLARNPDDTSLRERIEQIERGSMSSIGMATLSENVVESALKRQTARPSRSVRSFFASLAGRRAPAPVPNAPTDEAPVDASNDATGAAPADPDAAMAEHASADVAAHWDGDAQEPPAVSAAAAELASFDPFAPEPSPSASAGSDRAPEGVRESRADRREDRGTTPARPALSLNELFPDKTAAPRAETAAETLATAFGRPEPAGRPTRAASNELSLDHVFRGAPEGAPAPDGGFSFDQFFSDASSSASDNGAVPAASPPASGHAAGDTHDIEQFTAWLEGLKKK